MIPFLVVPCVAGAVTAPATRTAMLREHFMLERLRLFFIILLGETVLTAGRAMPAAPADARSTN
ncbi:hypothetical protein [Streptomyces sp. R302]|uniref:hypothetical protein n=1 Tax=Streptomyces sp. R302 TaxID=2728844 RepID=UPI00145F0D24|nr:hypothetical protein [Streptomyces sp. R302]